MKFPSECFSLFFFVYNYISDVRSDMINENEIKKFIERKLELVESNFGALVQMFLLPADYFGSRCNPLTELSSI